MNCLARRKKKLHKLCLGVPGYDPTPDGDYVFDVVKANRVIDFFEQYLTHIEGKLSGKPFLLEPWQKTFLANLFGWVDPVTGYRRYREAFLFIGRKNGKTPYVAGIALYVLLCDGEAGAQNYCAAAETEQAALLFRHASGMLANSPALKKRCHVYGSPAHRSIVVNKDNSFLKVLSSDAHTKHGSNSHFVAIDELHTQKNRELVDVLETSQSSENRTQPILLHLTTSDFEREGSICNEKHDYASKVRDGIIVDDQFLPMIYEATLDDDWTKEKTWAKANPNLGVSVSLNYLRSKCKKAQESPAFENTFKRLHLNIRTEQQSRWLAMEKWDACDGLDRDSLAGRKCYGGLDLASVIDIAAFALAFPKPKGWDLLMWYWIPRDNVAKRSRKNGIPYDVWVRDGYMKATDGNVIDHDVIRNDIVEIGKRYNILGIGIDRWNAAQITTQLDGDGFDVVGYGQGFRDMSGASKAFEGAIVGGNLGHGGCPVLRWMASNCSAKSDPSGNIKPDKSTSSEKIDGIVAAVMAIGLSQRGDDKTSVYTGERGLVTI